MWCSVYVCSLMGPVYVCSHLCIYKYVFAVLSSGMHIPSASTVLFIQSHSHPLFFSSLYIMRSDIRVDMRIRWCEIVWHLLGPPILSGHQVSFCRLSHFKKKKKSLCSHYGLWNVPNLKMQLFLCDIQVWYVLEIFILPIVLHRPCHRILLVVWKMAEVRF